MWPKALLSIASPGTMWPSAVAIYSESRHDVAERDAIYSESRPDVAERDAIYSESRPDVAAPAANYSKSWHDGSASASIYPHPRSVASVCRRHQEREAKLALPELEPADAIFEKTATKEEQRRVVRGPPRCHAPCSSPPLHCPPDRNRLVPGCSFAARTTQRAEHAPHGLLRARTLGAR